MALCSSTGGPRPRNGIWLTIKHSSYKVTKDVVVGCKRSDITLSKSEDMPGYIHLDDILTIFDVYCG